MRSIVEVPKFIPLDLKKIANLNPKKKLLPLINKKESLHKIAKMYGNIIHEPKSNLLVSDNLDSSESSMDEEMQNFIKIRDEIQEKIMPFKTISDFIGKSYLFKNYTKMIRDKIQRSFDLEYCFYGETLIF